MGQFIYKEKIVGGAGVTNANELKYSNSTSELQATNVQSAIDELASVISETNGDLDTISEDVDGIKDDLALKGSSLEYVENKLKLKSGDTVLSEVTITSGGSSGTTIEVYNEYGEFIGKTVELYLNNSKVTEKTFGSDKYAYFTSIVNAGTYYVKCESFISDNISVSDIGRKYSITLNKNYDGDTATTTDSITILFRCAKVDNENDYTTIDEVISDSVVLNTILSSENACKYIIRSTTWITSITNSSSAMTYIGSSSNKELFINDSSWLDSICNSTYFSNVLADLVPSMSAYSQNNYTVLATNQTDYIKTNYPSYRLFNKVIDTSVGSTIGGFPNYIGIQFPNAVNIKKFIVINRNSSESNHPPKNIKLQYSDDGSSWNDCLSYTNSNNLVAGTWGTNNLVTRDSHLYWRLYGIDSLVGSNDWNLSEVYFYG